MARLRTAKPPRHRSSGRVFHAVLTPASQASDGNKNGDYGVIVNWESLCCYCAGNGPQFRGPGSNSGGDPTAEYASSVADEGTLCALRPK